MKLLDKTIESLKKLAKQKCMHESGGDVYSASGGNFDDAYSLGYDDGAIGAAREILKELNIEY